ncbi:hypothetical protein KAR91_81240 [Candidatus Pacearchaeota archaeon]|nr:hypothetical protein [Candidatus Pacearchaeota archaeon]
MTKENTGTREVCNKCNSIWAWQDTCCPECGSNDTEDWHDTLCECRECKSGKRGSFDVIKYAKDELKRRSLVEASKHIGFDIEERIEELEDGIRYVINSNHTCPFTGKEKLKQLLRK